MFFKMFQMIKTCVVCRYTTHRVRYVNYAVKYSVLITCFFQKPWLGLVLIDALFCCACSWVC